MLLRLRVVKCVSIEEEYLLVLFKERGLNNSVKFCWKNKVWLSSLLLYPLSFFEYYLQTSSELQNDEYITTVYCDDFIFFANSSSFL